MTAANEQVYTLACRDMKSGRQLYDDVVRRARALDLKCYIISTNGPLEKWQGLVPELLVVTEDGLWDHLRERLAPYRHAMHMHLGWFEQFVNAMERIKLVAETATPVWCSSC